MSTIYSLPSYYLVQLVGLLIVIILLSFGFWGVNRAPDNLMLKQLYKFTVYISLIFLASIIAFSITVELVKLIK
jgi:multisubunit Na+/H+ antiporter MnhG subunit